jgi:hypothetical protein
MGGHRLSIQAGLPPRRLPSNLTYFCIRRERPLSVPDAPIDNHWQKKRPPEGIGRRLRLGELAITLAGAINR